MISTILQKSKPTLLKALKYILVTAFWIFIWEALSRIISINNELLLLILPSPITVFKRWLEIAFKEPFILASLFTLLRIFTGFFIGAALGFLLGVLTHISSVVNALLSPIIKVIRAVPVVATVILLYLFFKSDILPVVIVALMVMPLIWQTVNDSLSATDKKLLEMAACFKLGPLKTLLFVKFPLLLRPVVPSLVNALGLAWKSGVAAEVLSLPDSSLGTFLWQGKGNVNYDEVYAVTLTVVLLSIIIEILLKYILKKVGKGNA